MGILAQDDKDFLVAVAAYIVHANGDPSLLEPSIKAAQSGILSNTTIFKRTAQAMTSTPTEGETGGTTPRG